MNQELLQKKDQFEGTIRPIDISKDAQNLADFFNAIDDLWPGSWTSGVKYDETRAREFIERRNALQTFVAFDPTKRLVGFCSVHKRMEEDNVSYIGILGAHPDVLSKKYGKFLLLKAVEFSVNNGDLRQDLHTWASNMKAVPLYKKIGLQWVPKTSVYMQNYIPAILQNNFCKPFFQKHPNWYLNQKRELIQAPDEQKRDNMEVFIYRFEVESDSLEVIIDRYSRSICGITRQLNGEMISLSLQQIKHEVHAGLEQKLKLEIQNNSNTDLNIVLSLNSSKNIDVDFTQDVITVPNGTKSLEIPYKVHSTTQDSKDLRKTPSIKSEIIVNNEFVSLEVGAKIQQLIDIYSPSMTHWYSSGNQIVPINIQNRSKESVEGKVFIWSEHEIVIENSQFQISLTSEQNAGLKIPITINQSISSVFAIINCQLSINGIRSRIFQIPIAASRYPSVVGGVLKDKKQIILQNQFLQAIIDLEGASLSLYSGDHTQIGLGLGVFDYGPPFGFSEFSQTEFKYKLIQDTSLARVTLFQTSRTQPHLLFRRVFELRNGETHIAIWEEIENRSTHSVTTTTISSPHFKRGINMPIGQTHLVLDGELISGPCFTWPANDGDLPKGSDRYEPWIAIESGNETVHYHIFESKNTVADPSKSKLMTLEKTLNIESFKTTKGSISWLGIRIGGNYRQIRELANNMTKSHLIDPISTLQSPHPILNISLPQKELIIDQRIKLLRFSVQSFRNLPLTGKIIFKTDERIQFTPSTFNLENLNLNNPKALSVEIRIPEDFPAGLYPLGVDFQSPISNEEFNFYMLVLGSEKEPLIQKLHPTNGKGLWVVKNDTLQLESSPNFGASLISIKEGENQHLLTNFPSFQPSLLTHQDPGGLHTIILGNNDSMDDPIYLKDEYKPNITKSDPWFGIAYSTILHHRKSLKGLEVTYGYEILKGKANIIRVRITITNPTTAMFNFTSISLLKYGLNDSIENILCRFNHKENLTTTLTRDNPIPVIGLGSNKMNMITYENQEKKFSLIKGRNGGRLFPLALGHQLLGGGVYSHWTLNPGEKKEISFYIVINGTQKYIENVVKIVSSL